MEISDKLIDVIKKKQLVVLIDLQKKNGEEELALTEEFLVNAIKKRYGISQNYDLYTLYEYCIKNLSREDFLATLSRLVLPKKAPERYKYIRELKAKCIIETHQFPLWRNEMIDETMDMSNTLFSSRLEDIEFGEERQIVLNLFGDITYKENELVLTNNEYQDFISNSNSISSSLKSILKNPVIFIGYDPSSLNFKRIYDYICRMNGQYPNEAFLITDVDSSVLAYGKSENLTVYYGDVCKILKEICELVNSQASKSAINEKEVVQREWLPDRPYMYLNSYEERDKQLFFGRDEEIKKLLNMIRGSKQVTILSSNSGYGKTSLINAGLIPALREIDEYDVFYVRSHKDPWAGITDIVFKGKVGRSPESLNSIDINVVSNKRNQLIIIDQFEEFLVSSSEIECEEFDKLMCSLLNLLPTVSVLIAIRKDFAMELTRMSFAKEYFYGSTYALNPLSKANAIEAIIKPAELFGFRYEDGLANTIASDLNKNIDINNINYVDPSQLQIVCDKLFRETENSGEKTIKYDVYQKFQGSDGILDSYIEDSLKTYELTYLNICKLILKSLISSNNTRVQKTYESIIQEVSNDNTYNILYPIEDIRTMTEQLVRARLIRPCNENSLELTHEYIIRKIREWVDIETVKFKECSEIFNIEYQKWSKYQSLMPQEVFDEINRYRERIAFSPDQSSYVLISLINYSDLEKEGVVYWTKKNVGNEKCIKDLLWGCLNFKGYSKILSGALLAYIQPSEDVFNKILDEYAKSINPHFNKVITDLESWGFILDQSFVKSANQLLEKARKKDMIWVSAHVVKLGLSSDRRKSIVHKNQIARQLIQFFPNDERRVSLGGFFIDKFTVTNAQYAEYNTKHTFKEPEKDYPVVGLTLNEALDYARWWGKNLPTEDQWEFAARGDDLRDYPWGNEWDVDIEKHLPEDKKHCNTSLTGTDGVRSAKDYSQGVSPYGCYNMAGNVWEWTCTNVEGSDRKIIIKGGSWSLLNILPWTWYRFSYDKNVGYMNVGFRCVLNI